MDHPRTVRDLPETLKVFPLRGVILLPRTTLPLNVFEPRYLSMIDDVLAGDRLIGVIQPEGHEGDESPEGRSVALRRTGGAGRLTAFQESANGRYLITLSGIARFAVTGEEHTDAPYRICSVDWSAFTGDMEQGRGEDAVDRDKLLRVLKDYLKAKKLSADWDGINNSSNELLVNTLSMISPYGPEEKQALLEAGDLKARAEVLMTLAQMELAGDEGASGSTIQ